MSDIFISHVEEDEAIALDIAAGLEAAGYSCWYYERDGLPGVRYLVQIDKAIEEAQAIVVVISRDSLSSSQVDAEVERAHESAKHFIPILRGIKHVEFQNRKPVWRMAMGTATSLQIPVEGVSAIIPRIVAGAQELGIERHASQGIRSPNMAATERAESPEMLSKDKESMGSNSSIVASDSAIPTAKTSPHKESPLHSEAGFTGSLKNRLRRTPVKYAVTAGVVVLLGISIFLVTRLQQHAVEISFQERLLATVPPEYKMADYDWEVDFASDGSKVAYTVRQNEKAFVVVGDNKQPEFNWVSKPVFSPIGSRMLYGAREGKEGNKLFVVVDGKKGPEFDNLDSIQKISFSADGSKVVYVMEKGIEWFVAIDDTLKPVEWRSFDPILGADGKRLAYIVHRGSDTYSVMVDGKQGPVFDWINFPVFSPDSSKLAYVARRQGHYFVVVNDQQVSQEFANVETPVFSPDSSKLAFVGKSAPIGPPVQIVIGNDKGPAFGDAKLPTFSPDGRRIAYAAIRNVGKWFLVVGDKEGPQFDEIVKIVFSPDGRKVGYGVRDGRELWWKVMNLQ